MSKSERQTANAGMNVFLNALRTSCVSASFCARDSGVDGIFSFFAIVFSPFNAWTILQNNTLIIYNKFIKKSIQKTKIVYILFIIFYYSAIFSISSCFFGFLSPISNAFDNSFIALSNKLSSHEYNVAITSPQETLSPVFL